MIYLFIGCTRELHASTWSHSGKKHDTKSPKKVQKINKASPLVALSKWILKRGEILKLKEDDAYVLGKLLRFLVDGDKFKPTICNILRSTQEAITKAVERTMKKFKQSIGLGKKLFGDIEINSTLKETLLALQYLFGGIIRESNGQFLTLDDFSIKFHKETYEHFHFFDESEHPRERVSNSFEVSRFFLNPIADFDAIKTGYFKKLFGDHSPKLVRNLFYLDVFRGILFKRGNRSDSIRLQNLIKNLASGKHQDEQEITFGKNLLKRIFESKHLTSFIIASASSLILNGKTKNLSGKQGIRGPKFQLKVIGISHRVFAFLPNLYQVTEDQLVLEPCHLFTELELADAEMDEHEHENNSDIESQKSVAEEFE